MKFILVLLVFVLSAADPCLCWDQAELDLFDLVEEIGENFYDVLHVEEVSEIIWQLGDNNRSFLRPGPPGRAHHSVSV